MKRSLALILAAWFVVAATACNNKNAQPVFPFGKPTVTNTPITIYIPYIPTQTLTPTSTPTKTLTPTETLTPTVTPTMTLTCTATPYPTTCFWGAMKRDGYLGSRVNNSSNTYAAQFILGSASTVYRISVDLASQYPCSTRMGVYSNEAKTLSGAPSARFILSPWVAVPITGGGYQTFTATISPPQTLPAGTYWLACEVYSASLCDFFYGRDSSNKTVANLYEGVGLNNPFLPGTLLTVQKFPCTIWADLCP